MFQNSEKDMFGHAKLGGIGDVVSAEMKNLTAGFNKGKNHQYYQPKIRLFGSRWRSGCG